MIDAPRVVPPGRPGGYGGIVRMRFILPFILIALMLPYALGEDEPNGEWLIPPDPTMGVPAAAAGGGHDGDAAAAPAVTAIAASHRNVTTQPATQPAAAAAALRRTAS